MDYVLFGMGYGATLMLLGWALRTFGPDRKYKDVDPEDIDRSVRQLRWIRFIQGLGGVVSIVGTALVGFTFVIMLVNPDDETGSIIALATWAFLLIAILMWCWFYVSSFGTVGIWSQDEGYGFRKKPASTLARTNDSASSTSKVVPKPRVTDRAGEPQIGPIIGENPESDGAIAAHGNDDLIADQPALMSDEPASEDFDEFGKEASEPETADSDDADPEYDFGDGTDTTVPSEVGGRAEAIRKLRERQSQRDNS